MEATFYFDCNIVRYVEDESGRMFAKVSFGSQPILRLFRNTAYMDPVFMLIGFNVKLDTARLFNNFLELNFKEVLEEGDLFQRWLRVTLDGDSKQLYEAYYTLGLEDTCNLEVIGIIDDLSPDDFGRDED